MPAIYLQVQSISKAYGNDEVLNDVSLQVREGEVVGLIGPNGAGKTTLFRIIIGQEAPDAGEVVIPRSLRAGYLTQDAEVTDGATVFAEMLASREDLVRVSDRMHELEAAMAAPGAHDNAAAFDRLLHEHAKLAEEFHHLGGDTLESDARRILRGLDLGEELDDAEVATLSGGQKRRLALAKLLLAAPDLLLLDEPTNHLDLEALLWLEDYLKGYRGGVLIVTHDRYLLDRIADHIAEIEGTELRQFDGNYTAYQEKKAAENEMMMKRAESIQRERARLQEAIQRLFSYREFTRMRSMQKRLYKLESIQLPGEAEKTRMVFKANRRSGKEVLHLDGVRKRYTDAPLLEGVNLTVWRGDRIALVGPNGCGKTTLFRLLVGELAPDAGLIRFGQQADWYYYAQEGQQLDARLAVLQEVSRHFPHRGQSEIRGALARFLLFDQDVERRISTLSGGERSRVALTEMFLSGANLLILDEPTNHLDIDGKESLEEALADYPGTVLMISHDRYFIDRVATRVLELDNGRITEYLGNYTDYLRKKAEQARPAPSAPKPDPIVMQKPAAPVAEKPARRSLQYWQRRQTEVEEQIESMEARKADLVELLSTPDLYSDALRAKAITEEHLKIDADLQAAYASWDKIAEEILAQELEAETARQERLAKR